MNWLRSWRIKTKILALILLMATFIGIVGFVGYYYNAKANAQITNIYSNHLLSVSSVNAARAQSRATEAAMFHFLLAQDKTTQAEQLDELKTRVDNFDKFFGAYLKIPADAYEKEREQKIQQELTPYRAERQKGIDMANLGDQRAAYDYFTKNALPHIDVINKALEEIAEYNTNSAYETNSQNDADYALSIKVIITTSVMASLLCIMLGLMVASSIVKPLNFLKKELDSLADNGGDLTQVIPIDTKDEVGDLARAINKFLANLRTIMTVVMEQAQILVVAIEQISSGTEQMAKGATSQAGETQYLTDRISEMASAAEEVAASSEETVKAAQAMAKDVQEGKIIVEMTGVAMKGIGDNIHTLEQRSAKIDEIIGMINDIASQTNLLALNAAIEAARAGEHGRGFAVVADEIRKLAERSSKATKEIGTIISEMQNETASAVSATEEGGNATHANGVLFERIFEFIQTTHQMVDDVYKAATSVAELSTKSLTSIQSVAAITEEFSASTEETASSAVALSEMSEKLINSVKHFKL
ncbi:methyl-accepting chemotaxis protein [Desulfosporosinus sp. Sb-LF]|uniref:methyl-accepting chemotaxis protein n=1 Tax=Desulfosporosinus sp. Sb-LF TaxID=2560027 RepID=UPI0013053E5B|nr:methyl-accepting chemotaxis protein [Desulfosporosinus sp. Sb-LF]